MEKVLHSFRLSLTIFIILQSVMYHRYQDHEHCAHVFFIQSAPVRGYSVSTPCVKDNIGESIMARATLWLCRVWVSTTVCALLQLTVIRYVYNMKNLLRLLNCLLFSLSPLYKRRRLLKHLMNYRSQPFFL